MPELPEVETLRRGLEREVVGRRILTVVVANPKALKGQRETVFRERSVGCVIRRVDRRGKYLLIPLESPTSPDAPPVSLCIHLKMRGKLLLEDAAAPVGQYHCLTLTLDSGRDLRFYDMWTWGEMRALTAEEVAATRGLKEMGAEPLTPSWNGAALAAALRGRKTAIKPALLDQRVLAGVGNIYADEALFRAKIHPRRVASEISAAETERLVEAIRAVLGEAIASGGSAGDYVDADGRTGRFTPRVYDRGGAPCGECGATLTRIRLGGRGTVFCPQCQA